MAEVIRSMTDFNPEKFSEDHTKKANYARNFGNIRPACIGKEVNYKNERGEYNGDATTDRYGIRATSKQFLSKTGNEEAASCEGYMGMIADYPSVILLYDSKQNSIDAAKILSQKGYRVSLAGLVVVKKEK